MNLNLIAKELKWISMIGFLVMVSFSGYADTYPPVAPASVASVDQMDDTLSRSLETAKKVTASNEEVLKNLDDLSNDVDEMRVQFRRNRHKHP